MKLNKELAQEIANKVMNVIPYNVNIMDEEGLIIGSGDPNRINTYHDGAVAAIKLGEMITIYDTKIGTKPGVNIPINFKNRIIGVIGISGDPDIVNPLASLVKVTAELLINQEYLFAERRVKEQMVEEFLYQWAFRKEDYDTSFINSGKAIGIDLTIPRKAIIIKGRLNRDRIHFSENEFWIRFNPETILFIVPAQSEILNRIQENIGENVRVGVGSPTYKTSISVQEAQRTIEIAEKLGMKDTVYHYNDLRYIDFITNKDIDFNEISKILLNLAASPKGHELVETLLSYIQNSGDVNAVSNQLHIHRNSLAYRLQKIESITGRNPKNFTELFQLYIGYIMSKMGPPTTTN
jgi:carbohydrate diacid regulator